MRLSLLVVVWLFVLGAFDLVGSAQTPAPLRVMTFNVRFGTASDGENHWDKRKEFLAETIKAFEPELLGTQETLGFQRDYLGEQLPGYGVLGVGRDDGKEQGEMMALCYKKARFEKLGEGHFWLSEAPDTPGSKSWDSSLPRMATWVKLKDLRQPSAQPIFYLNTHFDHRGPMARLESAKLVRRRIEELARGCSILVTGDFNSGEGSPPYQALFGELNGQKSLVIDAYRSVHPERAKDEGTATGFDVTKTGGSRIDWIGCSRDFQVLEARINRVHRNGRPPSDHFPVEVVVRR